MSRQIKLAVVVGARPQFIKAAALNRAIGHWNASRTDVTFEQKIIHTGQHYSKALSEAFFEELGIDTPEINLGVGSASHAVQSAKMLVGLEEAFIDMKPDMVVVYGDTNSTMAAALAAAKLNIPIAHIEAGLREHNRSIPEEVNKLVTDHLSEICFAPTPTGMINLKREGLIERSVLVGDIMLDTTVFTLETLDDAFEAETLTRFGVESGNYFLATTHRAATRADKGLLTAVLSAFRELPAPVVLPLHPSTKAAVDNHSLQHLLENGNSALIVAEPQPYRVILALMKHCKGVLTDSGGLIKESYYFQKPCVTVDNQTEWLETLENGWNVIAGPDKAQILAAAARPAPAPETHDSGAFGTGVAAHAILEVLAGR